MNIEERIELFSRQVQCGAEIYTWHYDQDLSLLGSNCPREAVLDMTLASFGGKEALLRYMESPERPLVLSIPLGLIWCASATKEPAGKRDLYLIGPVWSTDANLTDNPFLVRDFSRERGVSRELIDEVSLAHKALPVVMPTLMNQYALLLHCTVTGEQLSLSDLVHERSKGLTDTDTVQKRDRQRTWQIEQTMLRMVREGDLGYSKVFDQASNVSSGVPLKSRSALRQAKTSIIVFTSLCTRAAIEGGLSPEEAYTLGDQYIQTVENAGTLSDLAELSYGMYGDFVERVRNKRIKGTVSRHVKAVCDYVELHAEEPFTNEDLARRAGYSEQYLRRKFREEMGISLPDYIRDLRIRRAKTLLADSSLPIQDIADTLQFCSRAHFSETFTRLVGETPARYREHHQK